MRRLVLIASLLATSSFCQEPPNRYAGQARARESHRRADAVLYPAWIAAQNAWAIGHSGSEERGHYDKLNAGDKQRFDAAVKAFEEWKKAMKEAGY